MIKFQMFGENHWLSVEEQQAVEASGVSTWLEYATTPDRDPDHVYLKELEVAMHCRPDPVEDGERPVHVYVPDANPLRQSDRIKMPELWHLRQVDATSNVGACGGRGMPGWIYGFNRFGRMLWHEKICPECRGQYYAEVAMGTSRSRVKHCAA